MYKASDMLNPEVLEKEYRSVNEDENKAILLKMMKYVHEFCEIQGIRYFLYFGSLLGAVRHKGFIPWDDDIDICMTRKEYERFIKVFPHSRDSRYSVMTFEDENHYVPFAKIVDNETYLIELEDRPISIYIDLFIIDNEGHSLSEAKLFLRFVSLFVRMRNLILPERNNRTLLKKNVYRVLHLLFKHVSLNGYLKLIDTVSKLKKDDYLYKYAGSVNASKYNERQILQGEWFKEGILTEFEDAQFWIPKEYDNILNTIYRNYMEIPKRKKIEAHHKDSKRWVRKQYHEESVNCWRE